MAEKNGFLPFVNAAVRNRGGCCDVLGIHTQMFLTADPLWVVSVERATGVCIQAGLLREILLFKHLC